MEPADEAIPFFGDDKSSSDAFFSSIPVAQVAPSSSSAGGGGVKSPLTSPVPIAASTASTAESVKSPLSPSATASSYADALFAESGVDDLFAQFNIGRAKSPQPAPVIKSPQSASAIKSPVPAAVSTPAVVPVVADVSSKSSFVETEAVPSDLFGGDADSSHSFGFDAYTASSLSPVVANVAAPPPILNSHGSASNIEPVSVTSPGSGSQSSYSASVANVNVVQSHAQEKKSVSSFTQNVPPVPAYSAPVVSQNFTAVPAYVPAQKIAAIPHYASPAVSTYSAPLNSDKIASSQPVKSYYETASVHSAPAAEAYGQPQVSSYDTQYSNPAIASSVPLVPSFSAAIPVNNVPSYASVAPAAQNNNLTTYPASNSPYTISSTQQESLANPIDTTSVPMYTSPTSTQQPSVQPFQQFNRPTSEYGGVGSSSGYDLGNNRLHSDYITNYSNVPVADYQKPAFNQNSTQISSYTAPSVPNYNSHVDSNYQASNNNAYAAPVSAYSESALNQIPQNGQFFDAAAASNSQQYMASGYNVPSIGASPVASVPTNLSANPYSSAAPVGPPPTNLATPPSGSHASTPPAGQFMPDADSRYKSLPARPKKDRPGQVRPAHRNSASSRAAPSNSFDGLAARYTGVKSPEQPSSANNSYTQLPTASVSNQYVAEEAPVAYTQPAKYNTVSGNRLPEGSISSHQSFDEFAARRPASGFEILGDAGSRKEYDAMSYQNLRSSGNYDDEYDRSSVVSSRSNYANMRPCPVCAKPCDVDANFCSQCGTSIGSAQNQQTADSASQRSLPGSHHSVVGQYDIPQDVSGADRVFSNSPASSRGSKYGNRNIQPLSYDSRTSNVVATGYGSPTTNEENFVDPLGRKGCPIISFGNNGKLVTMKPHIQKRFINSSGVLNEVEKIMPGFIKIVDTRHFLSSSSFVTAAKKATGPQLRRKKKDVIQTLEDLIATNDSMSLTEANILPRFLHLLIKSDGKLSTSPTFVSDVTEKVLKPFEVNEYAPISSGSDLNMHALTEIRSQLHEGNKDEALKVSMKHNHWTMAIILAGQVGKDRLAYVINEFVQRALAPNDPLSSYFGAVVDNIASSHETLANWREHVSLILANKTFGDLGLISLGDVLMRKNQVEAAHLCYLLGGGLLDAVNSPNAKLTLLGANVNNSYCAWETNQVTVMLTELYEFALRLVTPDTILPHFQVYKLAFALKLADYGMMEEASQYCESIITTIRAYGKPSQHFDARLMHYLEIFQGQLAYQGYVAKSSESTSWMKGFLNQVDKTLTGLIGVESEHKKPPQSVAPPVASSRVSYPTYQQSNSYGPQTNAVDSNLYSRYSYPTTFSQTEQNLQQDYTSQNAAASQPYQQYQHTSTDRYDASYEQQSSYGYEQAPVGSPQNAQTYGTQYNTTGYDQYSSYNQPAGADQGYNSNSYGGNSGGGYTQPQESESLDDYGFGNPKARPKVSQPPAQYANVQQSPVTQATSDPVKPAANNGEATQEEISVLGRFIRNIPFFRGGGGNSKKSDLGEENQFVYDPVLKKWVNKNSSGDEEPAAPLAPPPTTPVPFRRGNESPLPNVPPSTPAQHSVANSRSQSPAPEPSSLRRSVSSASRRNPRSRYVDTLNPTASPLVSRSSSSSFSAAPGGIVSLDAHPELPEGPASPQQRFPAANTINARPQSDYGYNYANANEGYHQQQQQ